MTSRIYPLKTDWLFIFFQDNSDSSDSSDSSDYSDDSEDSAATTEESDVEESVVFDAKIMHEQKKFTARQLDEDADMRRVEAQRLIEIKNIQRVEDIIQKCNVRWLFRFSFH